MLAIRRKGVSLIEIAVVIAILAILALPMGALIAQNLTNTAFTSRQIKEQEALATIMADVEKALRTATKTGGAIDLSVPKKIIFNAYNPQALIGTLPTISTFTYELKADGLFYKNNVVFPLGLEANLVTSLTFPVGATKQALTTAPYFVTVHLEAINPNLGTSTSLEKTIYLINY